MRKIDTIRSRLENALEPLRLQIIDESGHHVGHAGAQPNGETHFRVEVVSRKFAGVGAVARHRMIYAALDGAFQDGLHALEIHAKAPGE